MRARGTNVKLVKIVIQKNCTSICFNFRGLCRYAEPIEDLRMIYDKKQRRILRKQQTYEAFRDKLNVSFT